MQRRASFRRLAIESLSTSGVGCQQDAWNMPEISIAPAYQAMIPAAEPRRLAEDSTPPEHSAMLGFQGEWCAI